MPAPPRLPGVAGCGPACCTVAQPEQRSVIHSCPPVLETKDKLGDGGGVEGSAGIFATFSREGYATEEPKALSRQRGGIGDESKLESLPSSLPAADAAAAAAACSSPPPPGKEDSSAASAFPTTCPHCGNTFLDDSIFCRKCGKTRERLVSEETVRAIVKSFVLAAMGGIVVKLVDLETTTLSRYVFGLDASWEAFSVRPADLEDDAPSSPRIFAMADVRELTKGVDVARMAPNLDAVAPRCVGVDFKACRPLVFHFESAALRDRFYLCFKVVQLSVCPGANGKKPNAKTIGAA